MNDLMNPFGQNQGPQSFDKIRISIASPERIRSWSFGEIKKPETSTIVPSSRRRTACSAPVSSARSATMNVCAVSTSG